MKRVYLVVLAPDGINLEDFLRDLLVNVPIKRVVYASATKKDALMMYRSWKRYCEANERLALICVDGFDCDIILTYNF